MLTKINFNLKKKINYFINRFLKDYEYIYLTSDLRGFIYEFNTDPEEICKILFSELVKQKKTIIIPAFSFKNKGKFDIKKTKSNLGFMTKWALKNLDHTRSEHPIFSVISIGKNKNIVKNIGKSAFGYNSIFYRLYFKKTSLMHFGRPFQLGNTVIHFVEQISGAYYRENILIKTKVYSGKNFIGKYYSIFARRGNLNNSTYISNTKKIDKLLKKNRMIHQLGNEKNLTNISHIDMSSCVNFMCDQFNINNKLFIN